MPRPERLGAARERIKAQRRLNTANLGKHSAARKRIDSPRRKTAASVGQHKASNHPTEPKGRSSAPPFRSLPAL